MPDTVGTEPSPSVYFKFKVKPNWATPWYLIVIGFPLFPSYNIKDLAYFCQTMSWIMHFLHTITQWFVPWCHIQSFSYRETWLDMLYIGDWFSHGLISSSQPDSTCREFLPDRWGRKRRRIRSWRRPRQNSWRWPRICRLPSEDICWQTSWKSEATVRFTSCNLFISSLWCQFVQTIPCKIKVCFYSEHY